MDRLPQDERFCILLHKKIMHKTGSARRRAKKYYKDIYAKTGLIPGPLLLVAKGIMEGRRCSGRRRVLPEKVKKRFTEMLKASSDLCDPAFIYIPQRARTVKNYHFWLEEEFGLVSLAALRHYLKQENLTVYLHKPDFEEELSNVYAFQTEPVLDLVQVDGAVFQYLKIRDEKEAWQKPRVIEVYDTGSRYMFDLEAYFSESSLNAIQIFTRFLQSTPFPQKTIRFRPDNAPAFRNLMRAIHALNLAHSLPEGFYLKADFARVRAPKDKAHLESSHRSLHHFEIRIIKHFQQRIVKVEPGYLFKNGRKLRIMVTLLDISLEELRQSGLIQAYRREHNQTKHHFSVEGKTSPWVPAQKLEAYLAHARTLSFTAQEVKEYLQYGYEKTRATVSPKGTLTFRNQTYYVAKGLEKFSKQQSTRVYISLVEGKLLLFEYRPDGLLLGEALSQVPFEKAPKDLGQPMPQPNEVERIASFLADHGMQADMLQLIAAHRKGLTLAMAQAVYEHNQARYEQYLRKLRQPAAITATALFNAFLLDVGKHQRKTVYERN